MNLKRIERGWSGHFICAIKCQWHRNTLVIDEESNKAIVISSVGQMPNPMNEGKYSEIGAGRYYETMIFKAVFDGDYWEADVKNQIFTENDWMVSDYPKGTVDLKAEQIHESNVEFVIANFEKLIEQ